MFLQRLLFAFVSLCIMVGESVFFVLRKIGQFFLVVLSMFRRGFVFTVTAPLIALTKLVYNAFKKRPKAKTKLFSLNYYLFFYRIKYFVFGFLIALALLSIQWSVDFIKRLPNPSLVANYNAGLSTHIYSRGGKLLYEVFREQNRTPVKLSELPEHVKWATISIEDKDFYRHQGVSVVGGMLRAVKDTYLNKKLQGGSTITQQLVKSALLTPERTIERKAKEIILALLVERNYNKDQILEMYLNQVPYGGTAWGIEEAAKMYFGKSAQNLTISEAALLAGLPQAPSLYSPYNNPTAAKNRQKEVLARMVEERYITKQQYEKSVSKKLSYIPPRTNILAPHFVFFVKNALEQEYGSKTVQEGGLRVYTTLDYDIQKEAEKILKEELEKVQHLNIGNGAILVTRPSTGEILAMVGSKDFFEAPSGAFNVTTALRQPGSSVKPLTYTLALRRGYTAATLIDDSPTRFDIPGGPSYSPVNYDGRSHGQVPLRYALANSYNITAVKVLNSIGVNDFINFADQVGIDSWSQDRSRYGLSLTLGGGEVTMIEMATAFGTIRNLGVRHDLTGISRINNSLGQEMYSNNFQGRRVIAEEEPFIISDVMSDNVARAWAFGQNSPLNFGNGHVSVKTGTTDEKKDNWTIGYTRPTKDGKETDILVAVWVGNNNNTPMNPALTSGITGAAPIWRRVMERIVNSDLFKEELYVPAELETKNCYYGRREYFVKGTGAKVNCYANVPNSTPQR